MTDRTRPLLNREELWDHIMRQHRELERLREALGKIAASNLVRHREIVDIARDALALDEETR